MCPVLPGSTEVQEKRDQTPAQFIPISGGDQSILPGLAGSMTDSPVDVPAHATNGNGFGTPDGSHVGPPPAGSTYTAIWNTP